MNGIINCQGVKVAGFTTDYINGKGYGIVRESLGDGWHITAKNYCNAFGIDWYEVWDTDDGDYYGWVDGNYLFFPIPRE